MQLELVFLRFMNTKNVKAHISLILAASMWGLMSPIGKAAMDAGITGLTLANMRMLGGAVCFWLTTLFVKSENVPPRDLLMMFFASMLGIVCNQGCFTFGLSLTSPVDSSIITTTMPIFTLVLAALFLKEPVTPMKLGGLFMGSIGALLLILGNRGGEDKVGSVWGDILCMTSQISFACYLTIFKNLISKYSIFTLMKWMFTYAAIAFIPFSYRDLSVMDFASFPMEVWLEVGFVVIFGTYFAYIFMVFGQKNLRPTIVSMYNYVQPVVGSSVAVWIGMSSFGWAKAFAALLIFIGVYLVTQSKSRAEMLAEEVKETSNNDKK